ncbi:MAG TPA: c-type cytochrome [Opitutaceae bacterium]|nr:c-type cytochrome [Opitutaceae bacterium]
MKTVKSAGCVFALLALTAAPLPAQNPRRVIPPTEPTDLVVAPGFKVELLYTVPNSDEGSWVALALDPKGRLIASDQYGGLYRLKVPSPGSAGAVVVERLKVNLNVRVPSDTKAEADVDAGAADPDAKKTSPEIPEVGAHGLLYAFDSLYVMVNERPRGRGLWRLRDTNGDDTFDEVKLIRQMNGSGEHGTHSVVLGPDGKSLYFANGNFTALPTGMEKSRGVAWGEDHLLPRMWDAKGHARGKLAPGGHIGRIDPEGKTVELFAHGFRNAFDIAFDRNGELFAYDSDMEWDQGAPWYMPTRINHVVDGGEYGWRSGAGRWPAYYADSLPSVIDTGPGSPTGVTFGTGTKFPAKYQRALFAADWTYGTLYAVHLTPDGASFHGEKEEFLSGKPLPLTDLIVNPNDGAIYFAVGGRRTQSALYRISYVGNESTAPAAPTQPTPEAELRRSLETLHAEGTPATAIATAWPHLAHADRFVRFAARVAIERQPAATWAERAFAETRPVAAIESLIALARVGDKALQPKLLAALGRFDFAALAPGLRLPLVRAWQLAFTRMGKPDAETCAALAAKFDPLFPHADPLVSRELASLLVYLGSTNVVAKTVPLLSVSEPPGTAPEELASKDLLARNTTYGRIVANVGQSRPDRQQIAYAYALRNATVGWNPKLRVDFFSWFSRTSSWKGGASFDGFLQNIRTDSLGTVTDPAERAALDGLSKPPAPTFLTGAITPKGPGRSYTVDEAAALMPAKLTGRDFEQGKGLFAAAACVVCHRFGAEGGGVGPDLTVAGGRYTIRDLLENIIEPSRVISDQYGVEQFDLNDGTVAIGRVVGEERGDLLLMSNPFAPNDRTRVKASTVKSRKPYPVSMMPPGLINALNPEELKDLVAYILSAGNPADPMFAPAK